MSDFQSFPDSSRVWVYQSDRRLTDEEVAKIEPVVAAFAERWVSHNRQLRAGGFVFYNQFLVLVVDESQAGASGCSIDKSVHFLQELGAAFNLDFFNRLNFAWLENQQVYTADKDAFSNLFQSGKINAHTIVFDNLVTSKGQLEKQWQKPLSESWHRNFV